MNEILKRVREINGDHFHRLWLKAKSNDMEDLTAEEKQLVEIMLEHEDQYGEMFENTDILGTNRWDGVSRNNPFLHFTMHAILEAQLESKEPIEAYQFVLSMCSKGCTQHEAVHLVEIILMHLLYNAVQQDMSFDSERYKFLLRKYKRRKPRKIHALLAQEFKRAG